MWTARRRSRLASRGERPPWLEVAALAAFLMGPAAAHAKPCCLALACSDVDPTACLVQGGIPGYCRPGEACGAASCDQASIASIREMFALKATSGRDLYLVWPADASADS